MMQSHDSSGRQATASKRSKPLSWLRIGLGALCGAIIAEAVYHAHGGLLASEIGPWAVRHHIVSPEALLAYERLLHGNLERLWPGLAIYVLFSVYWLLASKDRADDASAESAASSGLHQQLVGLSLVLICLPMPGLTLQILPASVSLLAIGITIEIGGVAIAIAARRELGRNWSREVRIAVGHDLVQSGPYARMRHPIYTGAICVTLGLVIQSGLASAFAGLAVLAIAYTRKIRLEEQLLQRSFGSQFDQYRARSWLLVPFLF